MNSNECHCQGNKLDSYFHYRQKNCVHVRFVLYKIIEFEEKTEID